MLDFIVRLCWPPRCGKRDLVPDSAGIEASAEEDGIVDGIEFIRLRLRGGKDLMDDHIEVRRYCS